MRLRNEEEFLDRAIESHLDGLDELVIVFNNCQDRTPEICRDWQARHPEKISVYEYQPLIYPVGSQEALGIADDAPESLSNYYNYALSLTTRQIVIKIDGDHIASHRRFTACCGYVRTHLKAHEVYPIFGVNLVQMNGLVGIYNLYGFRTEPDGPKIGPTPLTAGDHCFYFVDDKTWHVMDRDHGFEVMPLDHKTRHRATDYTYLFYHLKGIKEDLGVAAWEDTDQQSTRAEWIARVRDLEGDSVASFAELSAHLPYHFRGVDFGRDFAAALPEYRLLPPPDGFRSHRSPVDLPKNALRRARLAWRQWRYG